MVLIGDYENAPRGLDYQTLMGDLLSQLENDQKIQDFM